MHLARRRENSRAGRREKLEKKKAILAALDRATGGSENNKVSDTPDSAHVYYTLSSEEIRALINGDMGKIENWVSNLDRKHATWLLLQLLKEIW